MMKKKRILLIIAVCFIMTTFGCTSNEPKEVNDIDATVTIKMPNGTSSEFSGKYTGMAVKNVPNGKGVFISHNSDDSEWKYVGEFEEGRAVGKAQVENFQITLTFSGQRKEGLYSGDFSNGLPDGEGVLVTENAGGYKYTYEGSFKDGMYDGKGYLTFIVDGSPIRWGGTFTKGEFTPTRSEFLGYIISVDGSYGVFDINSKTAELLDNHEEYFNTSDKSVIPSELFVDYDYKKMSKSLNGYYGKLIQFKATIIQIFEDNTEYGDMTLMLVYDSKYNPSVIYYSGTIDVYEDDKIEVIATPAALGGFKNVSGGTTNVIELVATYVKKTKK